MRATLLDTGPIVGWLRSDDPDHRPSMEAIRRSAESGRLMATTREVIGEAYTLIRYRFAKSAGAAMKVLQWAETVTLLDAQPVDHRRAGALLARHDDMRLSYVDALLLAVAERHRVDEILTLDQELGAVRLTRPTSITVV